MAKLEKGEIIKFRKGKPKKKVEVEPKRIKLKKIKLRDDKEVEPEKDKRSKPKRVWEDGPVRRTKIRLREDAEAETKKEKEVEVEAEKAREDEVSAEASRQKVLYRELSLQYANLVVERDELVEIVIPDLETLYQVNVGKKEYELFRLRVEIRRSKGKRAFAQESLNEGKRLSLAKIDAHLDETFEKWQKEMKEGFEEKIKNAEERDSAEGLSDEDLERLNELYRWLVMKLHPDINPYIYPDAEDLWQKVVNAYKSRNLEVLARMAENDKDIKEAALLDTSDAISEILKVKVLQIEAQIEDLLSRPPLSMREEMEDGAGMHEKRKELDHEIEQAQGEKTQAESALKALLKG